MRVFLAPSIFMQRLAWLRLGASLSQGRSRTIPELAAAAYAIASAPMIPTDEDRVQLREYAQVRQAVDRLGSFDVVPAQDLWLLRSPISWNGSFTRESGVDIGRWALAFGLLRSPDLQLTPSGRRLVRVSSVNDRDWANSPTNPFVLTNAERFHCLLAVWQADGDLLRHWIPLLPRHEVFDRSTAGDLLVPALRSLAGEVPAKEREQLLSFATTLEKQSGESSSRGLREHWATSRLEQLVDLGILTKPRRPRFEFVFAPNVSAFLDQVPSEPDGALLARSLWTPTALEATPDVADRVLVEAFQAVKSTAGMADVDDLWFEATVRTLFGGPPVWINRDSVDDVIRTWLGTGRATFNVDKQGRVKYVKLRAADAGS